ncbi:MAG: hypothetical protein ACRDTN_00355 [Mycobacterium sp.]
MSTQLRLLAMLGAVAGAALMFAPTAAASPGSCESGECTLTLGGDPTDVGYSGFRPLVTDWWGLQPVDVVNQDGDVLGTYPVGEVDFKFPMLFDASYYYYHDFTPAGGSTEGDPYGLSGVALYDVGFGPGLGGSGAPEDVAGQPVLFDSLSAFGPDGAYYWVISGPGGLQNTLEVSQLNSSDYLTLPGQDGPIMLWDTLPETHLGPVDVAGMLPPDTLITWP